MTNVGALLGVHPRAVPAWAALSEALDHLADDGRRPVCTRHPDQWGAEARPAARRDAAAACEWCPVQPPCAAFADAAGERHGVWGGIDRTTRRNRRAAHAGR